MTEEEFLALIKSPEGKNLEFKKSLVDLINDFDEEVKIDTFYIEHWSLGIDLVILLRTPFAIIRTKGAY